MGRGGGKRRKWSDGSSRGNGRYRDAGDGCLGKQHRPGRRNTSPGRSTESVQRGRGRRVLRYASPDCVAARSNTLQVANACQSRLGGAAQRKLATSSGERPRKGSRPESTASGCTLHL